MRFVGDQPSIPSSCLSKEPGGVVSGRPGDKGDCGWCHLEMPSIVAWLGLCLKCFTKENCMPHEKTSKYTCNAVYACSCCCHRQGAFAYRVCIGCDFGMQKTREWLSGSYHYCECETHTHTQHTVCAYMKHKQLFTEQNYRHLLVEGITMYI